jgi:hypothetical protein
MTLGDEKDVEIWPQRAAYVRQQEIQRIERDRAKSRNGVSSAGVRTKNASRAAEFRAKRR